MIIQCHFATTLASWNMNLGITRKEISFKIAFFADSFKREAQAPVELCSLIIYERNAFATSKKWSFLLIGGDWNWKDGWKLCFSPAGRVSRQSKSHWSDECHFTKSDFWPLWKAEHDISGTRKRGFRSCPSAELKWNGFAGLRDHAGHCEGEGLFLFPSVS